MKNEKLHRTSIGGQAVIEGVMMRGVENAAIAVRMPDGTIDVSDLEVGNLKTRKKILKLPVIRGAINFFESMIIGYRALSKSADAAGLETEEPSKFEKFLSQKTGKNITDIVTYVAVILGIAFAVGLFILLPLGIIMIANRFVDMGPYKTLIQGVVRLIIFLIYLALVSLMKDIRRVFEYHGAEHKSIHCYEAGEELTVENVRKYTRLHPRCGTSFLLIVMVVSIIVFSFVTWKNIGIRLLLELVLLPLVAGLSYEIIKYAGRHDNILTKILSWPGIQLQRLTTREPDDSQLEVAIASLKAVLTDNREDDKW